MAFDYDGTHDLETSLQDSFGEAILHGVVVSNLASFVAREMALPEEQCHNLAIAGMLHDIGKLRLRSYVYEEKEAKLNIDELRYVRLHPSLGYAILKEHGYTKEILTAVLYHHENADGSGPFGKKSEEVPLFSRIIHLCDLLDQACCRKAFTTETWEWAKDVLQRIRGTMVDEECAEALEKTFSEEYFLSLGGNFEASLWNKVPRQKQELDFSQIKKLAGFFAKIVDYKSPFTSTHSIGVAERAEKLSRYMGFDEETVQKMYLAGALHDIGKVAVGNEILEKPDRLTDAEFAVMKHHAAYTYNILSEIDDFEEIRDFAAFHHERLDGTGYPFGKDASELNVQERMMACIDIYQALTESRPYKKGMSHERACEILKNMADKGWLDMDIIDKIEMSM